MWKTIVMSLNKNIDKNSEVKIYGKLCMSLRFCYSVWIIVSCINLIFPMEKNSKLHTCLHMNMLTFTTL